MSMNKTCPISNFTSGRGSDGISLPCSWKLGLSRVDCSCGFPSADRNLINVPPLQFPEEVQQVHGLVFASFWKRESLRTPSHAGSKRKVAAVVPFGFESESCSSGNAFSRSPSTAYPRAASYSELGRIQ